MSYSEPPNYGSPPPPPPGDGGGYGAPPPGGGYGAQPPGYGGQQPKSSVLAIVSLVTGVLGILCCGWFVLSIAALITGFLGRKEIAESGGMKTGNGLAMAGLILGAIGIVLGILNWVLILATDSFDFYYNV
ncbi:MAG TPA: DUF4190 domain-containing protein [Nocardioides sp.]|nr:DUF4190 domain-containing protein [Nocardioides sp.]